LPPLPKHEVKAGRTVGKTVKCVCGHGRQFHALHRVEWDSTPPDGHCFHWDRRLGFCECKAYDLRRQSAPETDPTVTKQGGKV
jgi:hypothetical protein